MKLITPLIYAFFLFPITAIAVGIETFLRNAGILGEYTGVIDTPTFFVFFFSILFIGTLFFWIANIILQRIEKLENFSISNHFRQSIFFYLLGLFALLTWIINGLGNSEEDGYLLMWIEISAVGVVTNYLFARKIGS